MTRAAKRLGRLDCNQALNSFFQDPEWMFKTGIGGTINAVCLVMSVGSPLFLPIVFALWALVAGYILRVLRYKVLSEESKLPVWDNWLELFISGLTWLAIQFGLNLILLSAVTVGFIVGEGSGAIKVYSPTFLPWALGSTLAIALIWGLVSFLTPFLMVSFATEERIQAGFAFLEVFRRAAGNPIDFVAAWLLCIGIRWAALVLPTLTLIGVFLIPSTFFIGEIIAASISAQVWGPEKRPGTASAD